MEQLVFLLVIGAIAGIKWLLEKSAELREQQKTQDRLNRVERERPASPMHAPRPTAHPIPDLDKAARRLREALGLPEEAELPPPLPKPQPPRILTMERVAPEPDLEQRTFVPTPPPAPKRWVPPARAEAAPAQPGARAAGLEELLRSREGLRKMVLAQEILGPPRGMVF
jgi:hypothetical protein